MPKTIPFDKIESSIDSLELPELLSLQKKIVVLIGKLQKHFEDKKQEAEKNLELIRTGNQ